MNIEFDVTENGSIDISKMNFIKIKEYVDGLKNEFINFNISSDTLVEIAKQLSLDERKNVQTLSAKLISFIDARKKEILRVKTMYNFDKHYFKEIFLAGVDEVGRGPLAGPIVAASVVLDLNISNDKSLLLGIKDSKKLSINHREELSEIIKNKAISYSIALLDNDIIDADGIAWSNNQVFKIAVSGLSVKPDLVLTDGYPIKNFNIENKYAIKGDEKSASIACASIIAKVYRDNLMKEYAKSYPHYGFEQNAGYGTKEHIEAIRKYGPCRIHRMSFLNNIL